MELIDLRRGADGEGVPLRFAGCVIVLAMRMFFYPHGYAEDPQR